jgi:light-regulated signal transduction histidine kinase (bacteriophytochrome)/CheY-like chemotaxis protein
MSIFAQQAELTGCDKEPIHEIEAVQGFGALIAVSKDWRITHYSANFAAVVGHSSNPELGAPLSSTFEAEAISKIRKCCVKLAGQDLAERMLGMRLTEAAMKFDISMHMSDGSIIIELERQAGSSLDDELTMLRNLTAQLTRCEDSAALYNAGIAGMRELLQYDRVMLYRFHEDESGEVVAESLEDGLPPYIGLRYPSFDIPKQARSLFLRNRLRIIADNEAEPSSIIASSAEQHSPLDLSLSVLRAHSPVHGEYMRNIGTQASLSIAVIVRGRLWGLFACHHSSPRIPNFSRRTVAELITEVFSLSLERLLNQEDARADRHGKAMYEMIMRSVADGTAIADLLPSLAPIIQTAIPHDGISLLTESGYHCSGAAPNEEEFRQLLPDFAKEKAGAVFASDQLAKHVKNAEAFCDKAAGALILPVSLQSRDYLVLWRRELVQTVTWAGEPVKSLIQTPSGERLSPRTSFAAWRDTVRGKCRPWSPAERNMANELRTTLLEVVLKLTDEAMRERLKSQQKQGVLIAELNHRVRNILNLIRGLINQSRREALGIDDFAELIGGRINALASAHDNITRENWTAASLHTLIHAEAEAYLSSELNRITILGEDVMIAPEAYTVLALVIHEMITNSVKYGALSNRRGTLSVSLSQADGGLAIDWQERGGPSVVKPTRRGFGSTIIENSIPFELKGQSELSFDPEGVHGKFWVPGDCAFFCKPESSLIARSSSAISKPVARKASTPTAQSVLLVEDSLIIALEAKENFEALGVPKVEIESTVAAALELLQANTYQMALLDFNLGDEDSAPIIDALRDAGIPFWLATGYGDLNDSFEGCGAQSVLTKPYGRAELEHVLREFAQLQGHETLVFS